MKEQPVCLPGDQVVVASAHCLSLASAFRSRPGSVFQVGGKTRSIKAVERALSVCSGRQVAAVKVRRHQVGVGVDPGLTHRLQLVEAVPRHLELEQRFPPAREPSGVGVSDRNLAAPGVYADGEADELRRVEAIAAVKKLVVRIRRLAARFGAGVIAFDHSTTGNLNPFFSMSSPNSRSSSSLFIGKQVRRRAHLYLIAPAFRCCGRLPRHRIDLLFTMGGRVAPRPPFCRELVAPAPPACVLTRSEFAAGWASTIASQVPVGGTVHLLPRNARHRPTPSAGGRLPPPSLPYRRAGGWVAAGR